MEMLCSLRGDKHEFCLVVIKFKQNPKHQKTNRQYQRHPYEKYDTCSIFLLVVNRYSFSNG